MLPWAMDQPWQFFGFGSPQRFKTDNFDYYLKTSSATVAVGTAITAATRMQAHSRNPMLLSSCQAVWHSVPLTFAMAMLPGVVLAARRSPQQTDPRLTDVRMGHWLHDRGVRHHWGSLPQPPLLYSVPTRKWPFISGIYYSPGTEQAGSSL
jgi:hypothetical protein